jgi:hypothetical protein
MTVTASIPARKELNVGRRMSGREKMTEFLVAYDYGMGGLWGLLRAESAADIGRLYPEVHVVDHPPAWMTTERIAKMRSAEGVMTLDDPPSGLLTAVLADRKKRFSH